MASMRHLLLLFPLALLASACGSPAADGPDAGGRPFSDAGTEDAGDIILEPADAGPSSPDVGEYEGPSIVYGQSANTLYQLDPTTKAVTVIGPFVGCGNVIDMALDKDSTIYATTTTGLYRVDPADATCVPVSSGSYPNSLSFVPAGTVDPNVEALVGYKGSDYVRIDTLTGEVTKIGAITAGYTSSGDIVSVRNGGTYLTVKGPSCDDCLVKVDPKTGDLVENLGSLGYTDVFGLAYWAGKVYGFTDAGELFEVSLEPGLPTVEIPVPNPPPGLSFWGAGSTTSAPVGPN